MNSRDWLLQRRVLIERARPLAAAIGLTWEFRDGSRVAVSRDGRRLTETALLDMATDADVVRWATADERIPAFHEISALVADEGEG